MWSARDYKIQVRICSEAIFSSGERERNLVQSRALTDRHGFVYFHAKTLKGQLKRQAFWLLEQYKSFDAKQAESFFGSIVRLFGINNDELELYYPELKKAYHQQQGIMKLGHLELDERIRAYFYKLQLKDEQNRYYNISPHDLIKAQTHIRTGIQLEDGVVRDRMMTTYHTVRHGLIFYAKLSFDGDPSYDLENLQRIIYSFCRIGAGIHRGRGEIKACLLIDGKEAAFRKVLDEEGEYLASVYSD